MKIRKSQKPIRLKHVQVSTSNGLIKYRIYKTIPYGKFIQKQMFYCIKHGVEMNMTGGEYTDCTKKFIMKPKNKDFLFFKSFDRRERRNFKKRNKA